MFINVCLWVAYNFVGEFGQLISGAHAALIWIRRLYSSTASSHSLVDVCTTRQCCQEIWSSWPHRKRCGSIIPHKKNPFSCLTFCCLCPMLRKRSGHRFLPNPFSFSVAFLSLREIELAEHVCFLKGERCCDKCLVLSK